MRKNTLLKIISMILIASFLSMDVAWAFPNAPTSADRNDLAAESVFTRDAITEGGRARQADVRSEFDLVTSLVSIGNFLFNDQKVLSLLDPVMSSELKGLNSSVQKIDLTRVLAFNIIDNKAVPVDPAAKLTKDCIVLVPFNKNGVGHTIQIALKDNPVVSKLAGSRISETQVSEVFEFRILSGRIGEPSMKNVAEEVSAAPVPAEAVPPAERSPPENKTTTLYSAGAPLSIDVLFSFIADFISEHPYISVLSVAVTVASVAYAWKRKYSKNSQPVRREPRDNDSVYISKKDIDVAKVVEEEKSALVIGAGMIGRGLIGRMLNESGYRITFVNRNTGIVDKLNQDEGYNLDVVDQYGKTHRRFIGNVDAISKSDIGAISRAIKKVNTIFVAVFDPDLEEVSLMIAKGLENRLKDKVRAPLNIIVVSNRFATKHIIKDAILRNISPFMRAEAGAMLGVADTVTFDIIPNVPEALAKADPTLIQVYEKPGSYPYPKTGLIVDNSDFKGAPVRITGMDASQMLTQRKMQKLFIYNGAHAICAYLGYIKKYRYIQEAVEDPWIRGLLDRAFVEMRGLFGSWPEYDKFVTMVIEGLSDKRFKDEITRVAKDPIRKLSSFDRLVGPAKLAIENGRDPNAYVTGIAAALLYDDPTDKEAMHIQERMVEKGAFNKLLYDICGLTPQYDERLIGLISAKLSEMRREKAKAELKKFIADGSEDEKAFDNIVRVSDELPKHVKLIVFDFDNVVGNTQRLYAEATAIIYWRIVNGITSTDVIPKQDDPIYKEGKRAYQRLLAKGPASFLTIQEGIAKAKAKGINSASILSDSQYYEQFTDIREKMFSVLEPYQFFNPRMRELLSILRVLNPDAEFCVNTALDKDFFEKQFTKHGFRGYFSSWRALTAKERMSGNLEYAKVNNLLELMRDKGIRDESSVVVIDDSTKLMQAISDRGIKVFKIGVAVDSKSGMGLIDTGANAVFMNMKPTPEKLAMLGVPREDEKAILNVAPDVYIIRSDDKKGHKGIIKPAIEKAFKEKARALPMVSSEEARQDTEDAFEALVMRGDIKPNVVINIKDFSPNAVAVYMEKLKELSEFYNGNVTFVLVVESNLRAFHNDMPSAFTAIAKARTALGEEFDNGYTMMIADGGRKMRNMPLTLAFLYEGLMPYSDKRIRLHEVFVRTGGLLMQMPNRGFEDVAIVASDSVFNSENIILPNGDSLGKLKTNRKIVVPEVPLDTSDFSSKIVRAASASGKTVFVLAKPKEKLLKKYVDSRGTDILSFNGLHFLTLWEKPFLNGFLDTMQTEKMENGKPFIGIPCDMFMLFFQSTSMPEEDWMTLKPDTVTGGDWKKARDIAINYFGEKAREAKFARMESTNNPFTDEGVLGTSLPRFGELISDRENIVKKSPGIRLANATMASLENVIMKGSGIIVFGKNVKLSNVRIDMNGEVLVIPDNWVMTNSYLSGQCRFGEGGGYLLNGVMQVGKESVPLKNIDLKGGTVSTVIATLDMNQILVTVPINASKEELESLKFGKDKLGLMDLQIDTDIQANLDKSRRIAGEIQDEIKAMPEIFPLRKDAINEDAEDAKRSIPYKEAIGSIRRQIMRDMATGRKNPSNIKGQYWVTIEGMQGAGKTFMIESLTKELEKKGIRVVVIEEDWYHKDRRTRDKQIEEARLPNLGGKGAAFHAEGWHRWDKLREDIRKIMNAGPGPAEIELTELYVRDDGGVTNGRKTLKIDSSGNHNSPYNIDSPDTVIIYSGFYLSDIGKMFSKEDIIAGKAFEADLSVYLGISHEDSLQVKRGRDKWRKLRDIYTLDAYVYRPAFRRYIMTYDPAADKDFVFTFPSLRMRDAHTISRVVPLTRATGEDVAAARARERRVSTDVFTRTRKLESSVTSTKARLVETGKRIIDAITDRSIQSKASEYAANTSMSCAEIKQKLEALIKVLSITGTNAAGLFSEDALEDLDSIKNNIENLEADSIIASMVLMAKRAKRNGGNLVIGLETAWIPGSNDKKSLQYAATRQLVKSVESIKQTLRSLNIDNVEIVYADPGRLAHDVIEKAATSEDGSTDFSNVIILASRDTVGSDSFKRIVDALPGRRAFIAEVDPSRVNKWYKDNPYSTDQIDVKLIEMLSIALELSAGAENVPDIPLVVSYDREQRVVVFMPSAVRISIEDLKKTYDLQYAALTRMA